jgi:hypothetical protein
MYNRRIDAGKKFSGQPRIVDSGRRQWSNAFLPWAAWPGTMLAPRSALMPTGKLKSPRYIMLIRYRIDMEDVVAFNRYHCDRSPLVKRGRAVMTWAFPAALLLLVAMITVFPIAPATQFGDELAVALSVSAGIFSLLWILLIPGHMRRNVDRNVRRLYGEGANRGLIGPHELELTDTRLIERNPYGDSSRVLQAIEKVAFADGYAFIYVNAVSAHIVPGDAIEEGHFQAFLEALEEGIEKAWTSAGAPKRAESVFVNSQIKYKQPGKP